jgi:ribosome biogenesis protein ENP2
MKITNGAVPVYTVSGSEARPLPEWLIRRRKRCAPGGETARRDER